MIYLCIRVEIRAAAREMKKIYHCHNYQLNMEHRVSSRGTAAVWDERRTEKIFFYKKYMFHSVFVRKSAAPKQLHQGELSK